MVLDKQRKNFDPIVVFIANYFKIFNPDILTWIGLIFALFAGIFFYYSNPQLELFQKYLLIAAIFVFLNGLFDAIDGKVAKITKKNSKKGDFLDHALDRYGDILILCGLALSAWNRFPILGLFAISGMLLTSYMGTQSQAIGYRRNYSGLLGRADRLFLLMIAPIFQYFLLYFNIDYLLNFYLLEWVLIYFGIMGNITAAQRFYDTLKWINNKN
jgi:archaetidylinositol phosphate synthase